MKKLSVVLAALAIYLGSNPPSAHAWDYEGHRVVNQLALAALPKDFPAFVFTPAARERIAFLAGEPDRWRNSPELTLKHVNGPDHYLDLEQLADYGMTPETVPPLRYDFTVKLGLARAAHPEKFEPIDPEKNADHTRELVGFLPWAITEYYAKLKSEFSYLKTFQAYGGTAEEIANAEANIVYTMGVMGHYVGDGSQPLHNSKHHNGWAGENPLGYSTNRTFHTWIDGGYFRKIGGLQAAALAKDIKPAQHLGVADQPNSFFPVVMAYLVAGNQQVEPLYQLEKQRKLSPREGAIDPDGRAFMEGQIVKGAQMLGDIWFSAWQDATEDKHLKTELGKRDPAKATAVKKPASKKKSK